MVELTCPASSNTGAYQLSWSGAGGASYQLAELDDGPAPIVLYTGTDTATTFSGQPEGTYRYELTAPGGRAECAVEVDYPESGLVAALFCAGLVVTAATVTLVIIGHRRAG